MAKIVYAVLSAFAIELALFLFGGNTTVTSKLFGLLIDPSGIATNGLYIAISGALILIGATSIIIGTFYNINIYGIYAAVASIFLSFVLILVHLWTFIDGQLSEGSVVVAQHSMIATIIVAPLLITYMIITLDYVRGSN